MFQEIRPKRVFQEILDQMKILFRTKQLSIGQKIPPERELAEQLGVSRSSLREALKVLGAIGVIDSRTGEGTVVAQAAPEQIGHLLTLVFASGQISTFDLYEARMVIEGEAAALAADRRTDAELSEMAKALEVLQTTTSPEMAARADQDFHAGLIRAANNFVLQFVSSSISDVLHEQIVDTRGSFYEEASDVLGQFQKQHWEIYHCLVQRDGAGAKDAVLHHLRYAISLLHTFERQQRAAGTHRAILEQSAQQVDMNDGD